MHHTLLLKHSLDPYTFTYWVHVCVVALQGALVALYQPLPHMQQVFFDDKTAAPAAAAACRLLLDKAPSSVEPSMCLMHASLSPPLPTANSESAPAQAEPSTGNADSQCVNAASSVQQDEPQALVCLACHGFVDRSEGALQAAFDMVRARHSTKDTGLMLKKNLPRQYSPDQARG